MKDDIISGAVNLNGMINYQTSSVVSRTLIKKKTGTVTLFTFDQGQALSEHTTPFDAIAHIIDGEAEITVSGNVSHLKAGEDMTAEELLSFNGREGRPAYIGNAGKKK